MSGKPFLDTNVLVYAFASNDPRAAEAALLLSGGGVVSVQVLNEFVNVCRSKLRLDWSRIRQALNVVRELTGPPLPLTLETHEHALTLAEEQGIPFYDSLIVAAAILSRCETIYSEDFQDGRKIGSVTIRNPFRAA
jgi:predicted nucleic acid-binding protein